MVQQKLEPRLILFPCLGSEILLFSLSGLGQIRGSVFYKMGSVEVHLLLVCFRFN